MSKGKWLFVLLFISVVITGCSKKGSLNEGDSVCQIALTNMPEEFTNLDNNMLDELVINLELVNIRNEKEYNIQLNAENNFATKIHLNPGNYKVQRCSQSLRSILDMEVNTDKTSIELSKDKEEALNLYIENKEELIKVINRQIPSDKILKAGLFSRKVQINGKLFALDKLLEKLDFERDGMVEPYEKGQLIHNEYGLLVNVLNTTDQQKLASECKVIDVTFSKAFTVLPKGVNFGMSLSEICNEKTGIYSTPKSMVGSPYRFLDIPFLQDNLEPMSVIYYDEESGDQVTIKFSDNQELIDSVTYEFEKFE